MFTHRLADGTHLIKALPANPFNERESRDQTLTHNTQRYTAVIAGGAGDPGAARLVRL
jgi:hypothetical protein